METMKATLNLSTGQFSEFLEKKGFIKWYKSNRKIARYENTGIYKRISEKQYLELENEYNNKKN